MEPWGYPGCSAVKNLPAKQGIQVLPLDWEDPLEKETATSNTLVWNIPRREESGGLQPMGS